MKSAHVPSILSILFITGRTLAADCKVSGEVFGVDPVAQTILVRNEDGYLKLVDVDLWTSFTSGIQRERVTSNLQNIDSGDLVCVEFRVDRPQLAERIVDVPRIELQRKQREWLTTWQRSPGSGQDPGSTDSARQARTRYGWGYGPGRSPSEYIGPFLSFNGEVAGRWSRGFILGVASRDGGFVEGNHGPAYGSYNRTFRVYGWSD
jgi:hypothetical protein